MRGGGFDAAYTTHHISCERAVFPFHLEDANVFRPECVAWHHKKKEEAVEHNNRFLPLCRGAAKLTIGWSVNDQACGSKEPT